MHSPRSTVLLCGELPIQGGGLLVGGAGFLSAVQVGKLIGAAVDRVGPPRVCCRLLVTGEPINHATANGAAAAALAAARSGLVIAITSTGGIGQEFCSAYSASKFGLEGWIESLAPEVAPFGIRTMVVEPGFFRTDLLTPESTTYAEPSIEDYAQRTTQTVANWTSMNGKQGGDPAKLADALIKLVSQDEPPVRWVAGADAVQTVENKGRDLIAQADAYRDLSSSLAHDDD